jgi:hypothetical protein
MPTFMIGYNVNNICDDVVYALAIAFVFIFITTAALNVVSLWVVLLGWCAYLVYFLFCVFACPGK